MAWSTLAAGGVYLWAASRLVSRRSCSPRSRRPRIAGRRDTRALDLALLVAVAAAGLQVLPLPNRLRWLLSPRIDVDRFTLLLMPEARDVVALVVPGPLGDPRGRGSGGRVHRYVLGVPALERARARAGPRAIVATVGLVGAVAAIVQRAVDPTRLYGLWLPIDAGARPFGPFVNRNHFATWLLMADAADRRRRGGDGPRASRAWAGG